MTDREIMEQALDALDLLSRLPKAKRDYADRAIDALRERLAQPEQDNHCKHCTDGYYCVVCGKYIEAVDGVIVHDDIPHPDMAFDDEENPQ